MTTGTESAAAWGPPTPPPTPPPTGGDAEPASIPRPPGVMRAALTDAAAIIGTAFRLIWRHWPTLVVLYLAGVVGHELAMRGAVKASAIHGVLGVLVLLLAPIATLLAFILMLRTLRPSLPWLAQATDQSTVDGQRPVVGLINQLGSVLVPFLTVYVSYEYLRDDLSSYLYRVWEDETLNNPDLFNNPASVNVAERLPFEPGLALILVACMAFASRWLVDRLQVAGRRPWLGVPVAYMEIIWLTLGAIMLLTAKDGAFAWAEGRRVIRWLHDTWITVTGILGPVADPVRDSASWLWATIAESATAVIVLPIAWLVVGAVVYGHRITPQPPLPYEITARSARRWPRIPMAAHKAGGQVGALVGGRFTALLHGLRLLFGAGLVPMLLFCLVFVVAEGAKNWLWELERLIIGPQELGTFWMPFSGPLGTLNDTIGWVLQACLLAAAIDRVLRVQPDRGAPPAIGVEAPVDPMAPAGSVPPPTEAAVPVQIPAQPVSAMPVPVPTPPSDSTSAAMISPWTSPWPAPSVPAFDPTAPSAAPPTDQPRPVPRQRRDSLAIANDLWGLNHPG